MWAAKTTATAAGPGPARTELVDLLDLVIVLVAVIAAVGGFRLGFIGRVTSWLGLALGLYLAIRLLPTIVVDFATASPGLLVTLAAIVLIGGAMAGQGIGLLIGSRINRVLPFGGPWRHVDQAVGAVVGVFGILAVLWLLIPSVAAVPGWPARAATGSGIARWISRDFPTPPDPVQVLRRLIGSNAPEVFAELQPGQATGPPPSASPLNATVTTRVVASTVKVEGEACNRIYEGSGFAVAPDLIVTNAHVVAGEGRGNTEVLLPSGRRLPATVVLFDSNIDLALLEVPSLGENPLTVETANVGTLGAVFGHPGGQDPIAITPARVVLEEEAVGRDLYGVHTSKRDVLVLAAALAHGDSGGPLVDQAGNVIGVAFAISADQSGTSYALSSGELNAALIETRTPGGAATGSCLTD
jgi:S1-C subfamily serine protease